MNYTQFLEQIINEGIQAATADYTDEKDKHRLNGSVAGFHACRCKTPAELLEVWKEAQEYTQKYFGDYDNVDKYWWFKCYQLEVEWVCNVVSAILYNEGQPPILSWLPTVRGMNKAASIVGVSSGNNYTRI